ncbi:unnamed protein product [Brassicogethes aeneus]|uniref:SGTA homodimerisation domain-containing protein n=1 Tax=Brassicogethes aeneus TaxID=1431903 RepID=A0A9P0BHN6_BRAAE|nr:unnamed protein product [Brassicogethes aeneus]
MEDSLNTKKQCLVLSVIDFLQDELVKGSLNDEHKESIEVAIQCLESAFELDNVREKLENDKVDLLSLVNVKPKVEVSEEQRAIAEESKNLGNTHMKNASYVEAVEEYTKAIELNPNNAVYFCNRAAAYSRLEKHLEAIIDSQEAIRLDPTYGKAYGRLGIAYSNLNKYEDARKAYLTALKYDPGNSMYETNLKLAEERLYANMESAAPPEHRPLDIGQFINNPNLLNMATQMLSDPNFRDIMSGIMNMGNSGEPGFDALMQVGQTLATRMQEEDPSFVDNFRRQVNQNAPTSDTKPPENNQNDKKTE